ncbi:MAG: thiol-disulfide isomerase/thioredoxin [Glaciecola sp.]|jgi:thiol-disulfide isomerase/thioredoxin
MRTSLVILLFIPLLCSATFAHAENAHNFTLDEYRSNGQSVSLNDFKGKVVYLDFWASWCKPCRTSFPWMNQMQKKYKAQGLEVVSINLDKDKSSIAAFLKSYPSHFKILLDPNGSVASAYQLLGMPTSYLIDKNGVLRKTHTGFFIKNKAHYEKEIIALLSE